VNRRLWAAGSVAAFAGTLLAWIWLWDQRFPALVTLLVSVGAPALVVPVSLTGRRALDAGPTPDRAATVTRIVHAWLVFLFGVALITAIQTASAWRGLIVPFPHGVAVVLVCVTLAAGVLTVATLALRGLGAPFAVVLSRRLATDWLYARTRNPMVLATLVLFVALALLLRSTLFLAWHLALFTPTLLFYVKVYEERELEIRFGEPYRRYRASTPFLWPSLRPRAPSG
jgi:protein-S-isoprenylcysteine O-methyltransferase Ste14